MFTKTTTWSRVPLEQLLVAEPFNETETFYRTRSFSTVFTNTWLCHFSIQSTRSHHISLRFILTLSSPSTLMSSNFSLPLGFLPTLCTHFSSLRLNKIFSVSSSCTFANYIEQKPFGGANTRSTSQEITCFYGNRGFITAFASRRYRSSSPSRVKNFFFSKSSRLALGSTQPPIQWVPGALSPVVKRQGREADHSLPTTAEFKKMWIYTSTPSYAFMK
jgi:hypothetical protein